MKTLIETQEIPIIDLAIPHNGWNSPIVSDSLIERLAVELDDALSKHGTALLINHGINEKQFQLASEYFKKFCNLSPEMQTPYECKLNHGFIRPNVERFQEDVSEIRYAFNFDNILDDRLPINELPGFRENFRTLINDLNNLQTLVLKVLAIALQIPVKYFLENHTFLCEKEQFGTTFRLLHYPAIFDAPGENKTRCGAHCDYGTFTLLSQDSEGGLEIKKSGTDQWRRVGYLPGALFLNGGEILEIWSEQRYRALWHRVVIPEEDDIRQMERNVRALFIHSLPEFPVAPMRQLLNLGDGCKEQFVTSQEFLEKKLEATYGIKYTDKK